MSTEIPEQITATNCSASVAWRMILSPHEWTWTQEEQEAMALSILEMEKMRQLAKPHLLALHAHVKRSLHSEVLASNALKALGLSLK